MENKAERKEEKIKRTNERGIKLRGKKGLKEMVK